MQTTRVFSKLLEAYLDPAVRIIVMRGGTRSGKTWAILQLLHLIASRTKRRRVLSVVSETLPHLKRGGIRDFRTMLEDEGLFDEGRWNATDFLYRYPHGVLEFFSADSPGKVHGPARAVLFVNEAINISWEVYRQLAVRTTEKIIIDYNPAFESWIETKVLPYPDARLIHSTYLDNDMLPAGIVAEIERNREADPEWWKVYGEGLVGRAQGLLIRNWDIVQQMPREFKREFIGLDFGYGAPTAAEHIRLSGGEVWIDEVIYERGLTNPQIAERIKAAGLRHVTIVADSAEPRSIRELRSMGLNVVPADKGKDSIALGLQIMNRYKKHYTARSLGTIEENRKYRSAQNENGDFTGVPVPQFDHAKDAERYVFLKYLGEGAGAFNYSLI